ncbi:MAG TPA: penicillin-binding transpeptidase domain-containing protein [Solirubrobacteraceae bacterium]|nr:penicillin-binding transpeptidase domain-containing protein [Solirubrobacteraceae bacterium]
MIQPVDDRRPALTPQLALRVAILGSFALAMFAIIFFRLWFLQVLSGNKYVAQAQVNRVRDIDVPAQRGQILDQNGTPLVTSIRSTAVEISPLALPVPLTPCDASQFAGGVWSSSCLVAHPPPQDAGLYNRLAGVLGMSTKRVKCDVGNGYGYLRLSPVACQVATGFAKVSYANVQVKTDVGNDVLFYLQERADRFPGVSVQPVWLRQYPLKNVAAQLFGTIGPISPSETKDSRFKGIPHTAWVGQSGLEWSYNQYLQGTDGTEHVQVDALGRPAGELSQTPATPGYNLKLSLDIPLQEAGQQALQQSIDSNYPANAGAFVAMNPVNGEVYAMGSLPSFDPNVFAKPVSSSVYNQLNNPSSDFPLLNRAIQSEGPTGSTFKPITATAALESGAWNIGDTYDDTGQFCIDTQCRRNAGGAANGVLNLVDAIRVSDDVFFYNLGALTNSPQPAGGALQHWAHLYGIGQSTGIDLGGEYAGNLPTPAWRSRVDQVELQCEKRHHVPPSEYFNPGVGCGIADGRPWSIGDNINLAVGQGDVQVTPLQLAVAYSAIANEGTIVRPHIGLDVQGADGTVKQNINPQPVRRLNINPIYLDTIRQGLRDAASQPGGTSADVFASFPEQVYGKTGTAQYNNQQDYAWYACFVPPSATTKPIVVVVKVEQGGFGAVGAAPVAREILSQWFFGKKGAYVAGSSKTL